MRTRPSHRSLRTPLDFLVGAIVAVVSSFDTVFLSWWLDAISIRKHDKEFAASVENSMAGVFSKHGVKMVENDIEDRKTKRLFDLSFATASSLDFDLRFQSIRGEFSMFVRPVDRSRGWSSVESILALADRGPTNRRIYGASGPWDAADLLEQNWETLVEAVNAQGEA